MKKYIFLFISAAVLSISCTKGGLLETPASYAEEIVFEPYLGKAPETKAENSKLRVLQNPVTNNQFSGGFLVHAFEHQKDENDKDLDPADFSKTFMSDNVYWVEENKAWEQEYTYYWPEESYLAFAAVGLNAVNGGCLTPIIKEGNTTDRINYSFEVKPIVSQQVDLIVAPYQSGLSAAKDATVNIKFEHLLSRIGFKIQSTEGQPEVDIVIRGIKLYGDFPVKGDVNLKEVNSDGKPYITVHEDKDAGDQFAGEYSLFDSANANDSFIVSSMDCCGEDKAAAIYPNCTYNSEATKWEDMFPLKYSEDKYASEEEAAKAEEVAENRRYMMLMPSTQTIADNARIEVTYQLSNDNPRTASVALGGMTFNPGTTYEFRLLVSTSSIEFGAVMDQTGWDNGPDYVTPNTIPLFPYK